MESNYWKEYFKIVSPTWIENWYEQLKEYTIKSTYFQLTKEEINQLLNLVDGNADINVIIKFKEKIIKELAAKEVF